MTRHIPPELESAVAEHGTLTDKLLVALIEAVNEQTNEQKTIHDDLLSISRQLDQLGDFRDLSRQLEGMSHNLSAITGSLTNWGR